MVLRQAKCNNKPKEMPSWYLCGKKRHRKRIVGTILVDSLSRLNPAIRAMGLVALLEV